MEGEKKRATVSDNEVLNRISEKVTETLSRYGFPTNAAAAASIAVSDGISAEFGGQLVYFKKQLRETVRERNACILADVESGLLSTGEIARKYGISIQAVYEIVKGNRHEPNP